MILEERTTKSGQSFLVTETRIGKYQTYAQMTPDQREEWNAMPFAERLRIRNQEHDNPRLR